MWPLFALASGFEVVWNGPSAGCTDPPIPLAPYAISANPDQSFNGSVITLFYKIGLFPQLESKMNATPCWEPHAHQACSWNPWGELTPTVNGGVPQAADLPQHLAALKADVEAEVPDPHFSGLLIIDWEAWRPLYSECDDGLSAYREYSARLVRADPAWSGNGSALAAEAARRFDAGARALFSATVAAVRALRPHARIGFYSQGIDQDATKSGWPEDEALVWLWSIVDVLAPSIYPRSADAAADRAMVVAAVQGAIRSAALVPAASRPAVMPYARALVDAHQPGGVFDPEVLANQVQVPAALGADGVVLWGSSGDYHGQGCAAVARVLQGFAGKTISACVSNRRACSARYCGGHGRCVSIAPNSSYDPTALCLASPPLPPKGGCLCDKAQPHCATP